MRLARVVLFLSLLAVAFCAAALGENYTRVIRPAGETPVVLDLGNREVDAHTYNGYLRIYVVEPVSRYKDFQNVAYHYGFLGFAVNQSITVMYGDTLRGTQNFTFSGGGMTQSNVMAIAVVCNGQGQTAYSDPSTHGSPFNAYYVEAAAAALHNQVGTDTAYGSYTHNVFLEEATAHG